MKDPFNWTNIREMPELADVAQTDEDWKEAMKMLLCYEEPCDHDIDDRAF